jgi:hypothetical protein
MKIGPNNQFGTPENMGELKTFLGNFSGGEATVAQVCAGMAWNLACKMANEEECETPKKKEAMYYSKCTDNLNTKGERNENYIV